MVLIQKLMKYEERFDIENEKFGISAAAGAILTASTIITCGHCICNDQEPSATQKYSITCPKTPKEKEENLNKKEINEIYITVGKKEVDRFEIDGKFDDNLKVYIYNYEKYDQQPYVFSKNGDIAIVINKIGLKIGGRWSDLVRNICPPTPQLFKDGLRVKLAGWGQRYHVLYKGEYTDTIESTSCQTNEARSLNRHIATTFDKRVVFLDCEVYNTDPTIIKGECNDWLFNENLETLPLKIDLPGVSGVKGVNDVPNKAAFDKLKNGKEQKRCENWFPKAKKAWEESGNPATQFDNEIDRIVIKKFETTNEETCFNLKKVAKYGVCTTKQTSPRHWGFCSRSCYVPLQPTSSEPYEVSEFKYFDTVPGPSDSKFKGN